MDFISLSEALDGIAAANRYRFTSSVAAAKLDRSAYAARLSRLTYSVAAAKLPMLTCSTLYAAAENRYRLTCSVAAAKLDRSAYSVAAARLSRLTCSDVTEKLHRLTYSDAAAKLHQYLNNRPGDRPQWVEVNKNGKALYSDAVTNEGMAILDHIGGMDRRWKQELADHAFSCIAAGLDPSTIPVGHDINGGQYNGNTNSFWREHEIGFDRPELVEFLNSTSMAHNLTPAVPTPTGGHEAESTDGALKSDDQRSDEATTRRESHDTTTERGCRRLIIEYWDKIELLHGPNADGREVCRKINMYKDPDQRTYKLKTVQNTLIKLRKEGLIP